MCPNFFAQRTTLLNTIAKVSNNIDLTTLLYGDPDISFENNIILFEAVHKFITDTHRFE